MKKQEKKTKKYSIKFHIFSTMIALTLIMLVILWLFEAIFMTTAFKVAKENDVERAASLVAENFDSGDIDSLISKVSTEYDVCIKVINNSGN